MSPDARWRLVAIAMILIGSMRIASTYRVFSATADEATHVGAGLQLLQYHEYMLQWENPPLARAVLAVVPHLGGMRFNPAGTYGDKLHSVFYGSGKYERNLFLARIGNLVFFVLAAIALFAYLRRETDVETALTALFLFTLQPLILGHAGLATNDMAATAALALNLWAFSFWLERRTLLGAVVLAIAYAFAILCKFTDIAFVPLACAGIFAVRAIRERRWTAIRDALRLAAVVVVVTPLIIWAAYGFSVGMLSDLNRIRDVFGARGERFIAQHPDLPLPAPTFVWGAANVVRIDRFGLDSYFFGDVSRSGWRSYFPVALALKTTIPFLLLLLASAVAAWRMPRLRDRALESAAAVTLILLVASRSRLDLGVRYVLPVFVPLTMLAAIGARQIATVSARWKIVVAAVLVWHALVSAAAHPDYFPYFNAFAGRDPSRYLVDSNLDWGQDVLRLRRELRRQHVDRVGILLMGSADYDALQFPPHFPVEAKTEAHGWIAVSDHMYRMGRAAGGWWWLDGHAYRRIGKSIRLYRIP